MQLQLASLGLYATCRESPVVSVSVRVGKGTPEVLWKTRTRQLAGRLPRIRVSRISFGPRFDQPIVGVEWPPELQQIKFGCVQETIVLQEIKFGNDYDPPLSHSTTMDFNQSIVGVGWPQGLQQIEFGVCFNQPIVGVEWPQGLQHIEFGVFFDQPIVGVEWPPGLQKLEFGDEFDQPIIGVEWPPGLQKLKFGYSFNQPIVGVVWPPLLSYCSARDA